MLPGTRKPPARHPGAILFDEVMFPFEISQNGLAQAMGVSPRRVNEIVLGKRAITAKTAVLLEIALGIPARHWMQLQADYDIERARRVCHGPLVRRRMPPRPYDEDVPFDDPMPSDALRPDP
jgi:addiction module HigA family antidote